MTVAREPVLRPSARGGLAARDALQAQVRVAVDGAVEVVGGAVDRRLPAGAVARAVLLDAATGERLIGSDAHEGGTLVLLGPDGVALLALQLLDWAPPGVVDDATLRETSGAAALCRALGLPLEPWEGEPVDQRALRAALVRPGPRARWPGPAGLWLAWAALGLAIASLVAADATSATVAGLLGLASAIVALLVGVPTVLGLLAAARARAAAPHLLGDTAYRARPAGPVPAVARQHELRTSPDVLLLSRFGDVVALPGPSRGGVSTAYLEPDAVRLRDASGRLYSSLATATWCGDEASRLALRAALEGAGIEVLDAPVGASDALDLDETLADGSYARLRSAPADRGEVFAGPLLLVAAAAGSAAAGAGVSLDVGDGWQTVPALVLGAGCVGVAVTVVAEAWRRSRRRRRGAATVTAPASAQAAR